MHFLYIFGYHKEVTQMGHYHMQKDLFSFRIVSTLSYLTALPNLNLKFLLFPIIFNMNLTQSHLFQVRPKNETTHGL